MRRTLASAALAFAVCAPAALGQLPKRRVVDMSYPYDETTIFWPTEPGFALEKKNAGVTENGFYYASNGFCSPEHGGTHIDAPIHFAEGRATVDAIPLDRLMGEAIVVDVTAKCAADRDYQVGVSGQWSVVSSQWSVVSGQWSASEPQVRERA